MKKTTCRELRGACDTEIQGETLDEMSQNCQKHVMEQIELGDQAHKAAIDDMVKLSAEEQKQWYEDFKNKFDSLPDA